MRILYRFKFVYFFLITLPTIGITQTNLSGVINQYTEVLNTNQCDGRLQVADASNFEIGMSVLLIQMQGAVVNQTNTSAFGSIDALNSAGWYERNEILAINGNEITLRYTLLHPYDPSNKLQLVSIPSYTDAQVTGNLTAQSWNGDTGGVLVLAVENRLQITGSINVNGQGFRGGQGSNSVTDTCSSVLFGGFFNEFVTNLDNWRGAQKGESISPYIDRKESGRGPLANGGGGGNDHKAGGGGGAHHSDGGAGGRLEALGACQGTYSGLGGIGLPEDNTRLFLGGGGGGGHGNQREATDGGNGGGIIIIFANQISGNGFIRANGLAGGTTTDADAAGGGGAGGSIVLFASTITGSLLLETIGGNGGNTNSSDGRCFGPGGGGSGGRIFASTGSGFSAIVNGGQPGIVASSLGSCVGTTNGAGLGFPGETSILQAFPQSTLETPQVNQAIVIADCGTTDASSITFDITYPNSATFEYNVQINQMLPSALTTTSDRLIPVGNLSSGDSVSLFIRAVDGNGCSSRIDTVVCSTNTCENDAATVITNLDPSYCLDALPFTLTATPSGGTFSGNGVSAGTFNPNTAGAGTQQIIYVFNDSLNCPRRDTLLTEVIGIPAIPIITCETVTDSLIAFAWTNTAANYRVGISINGFQFPIPIITSNSTFSQDNLLAGDSVVLRVVALGINGCGDSDVATQLCIFDDCNTDSISILTPLRSFCTDTVGVQFEGSPLGGFFTGEAIDSSGFFQPSLVNMSSDSSQKMITLVYQVPATANCPIATDSILVEVLKAPESVNVICDSISSNLVRFSWSHPYLDTFNVAYSINGGAFLRVNLVTDNFFNILNLNENDEVEIAVEPLGNNRCGNPVESVGSCIANPCSNISLTITGLADAYCRNDSPVVLIASPDGGIFLGDGIDSTGLFNPANGSIGTNTIVYQLIDSTGCTFLDTLATIVQVPLDAPQIFCETSTSNALRLSWTHPTATSYEYRYVVNTNDTSTLQITNDTFLIINNLQPEDAIEFYISAVGDSICGNSTIARSDCQTLSCSDQPPVINFPDRYCVNDTTEIVLTATPTNGVFVLNNTDTISSFRANNLGVGVFSLNYTVMDSIGCVQRISQAIQVFEVPVLPAIVCGDSTTQSVNFRWQNDLGEIYEYEIRVENNLILSDTTSFGIVSFGGLNPGVLATITLRSLNTACSTTQSLQGCRAAICVETESATLSLDQSYCLDTINFQITAEPAGGTFSGDAISASGNFNPSLAQTGEVVIFYTYTDAIGCLQQDTARTLITTAPQPPVVRCGSNSSNSTQFIWSSTENMYEISISQNGMPFSAPIIVTDTQFVQNNLVASQDATIRIKSIGSEGCGNSRAVELTCSVLPCNDVVLEILPINNICLGATNARIELELIGANTIDFQTTRWRGIGISDSIRGVFDPAAPTLSVGQIQLAFEGTDTLGCVYRASTTVNVNETPMVEAGIDRIINCRDTLIALNGTATNANATTTYRWSSIEGNIVSGANTLQPIVDQPGAYFLNVANGVCESSDLLVVLENRIVPTAEAGSNQNINCQGDTIKLVGTASNTQIRHSYQWQGPNGFQSNDSIITTTQAGVYRLVITNVTNFCTSTMDSVAIVDNSTPLNITLVSSGNLTCINETVQLTGSSTGGNIQYQWSNEREILLPFSNKSSLEVMEAGIYTLTARDMNGCEAFSTTTVIENRDLPMANAGSDKNLGCTNTNVTLDGSQSSEGRNFRYQWTGSGAIINANSSQAAVENIGNYILTVSNIVNGCTASDTVAVTDQTNNISSVNFTIEPPLCEGDNNGLIKIENVIGGQAPYQYRFEGSSFSAINQFNNLQPGNYNIVVREATGCEYELEAFVRPPVPIGIDLGDDIRTKLGDSLVIPALIAPNFNAIFKIIWTNEKGEIICDGCSEIGFVPFVSQQIQVQIEDSNGCTKQDIISIYVDRDNLLFQPNVFSPNGDNNNDWFTILGSDGVKVVQNLKIYDRWGELVYFQPLVDFKNPQAGWDGNKDSKPLLPGVFLYSAEVIYINGSRERVAGEVTLLR